MGRAPWMLVFFSFVLNQLVFAQKSPDISSLLIQLDQPKETNRAARQILDLARKDPNIREYVVRKLPEMIDRRGTDQIWLNAVRLAGQLKASEAVASLQRVFSRGKLGGPANTTLGTEMQLDDDVVAKALTEIGEPSLPAVKDFLTSADRKARRRAVLILINMKHSPAADQMLKDHLPHEADPRIKDLIESGLGS